jgi:hypothetical protein
MPLSSWPRRAARWVIDRLAGVAAVEVGRPGDGLDGWGGGMGGAGGRLDPSWAELQGQLTDALEAWRKNPLARRLVGLTTAYVVGDGIRLSSQHRPLAKFLADFTGDPQNLLDLRQAAWCDSLSLAGELFVTLHMNRANGMSYVRAIPAAAIDRVISQPGDYETELAYHEAVGPDDPDFARGGRTWLSPAHPDADVTGADGSVPPVMLHFAVNRPVGCLRGESDLASVLPWLRRYSRWLEDRVRLNAAMRAFLWIVRVPARLVEAKSRQYSRPPEPGSVIVAEKENEEWQAVAPDLKAADAAADGRAIRWMVVAGGPGTGLTDIGEASDANLATAAAMGEQRARFMRARQTYFGYVLAQTALTAYNRAVRLGKLRGPERTLADIQAALPDISAADNASLGQAAQSLAAALETVGQTGYGGERWKGLALRLVLKFAGESVRDDELAAMLAESRGAA